MNKKRITAKQCRSALRTIEEYIQRFDAYTSIAAESIGKLYAAIDDAAFIARETMLSAGSATPKQVQVLARFGLPTQGVSRAEASRAIRKLERNGWKLPDGGLVLKEIPRSQLDREFQEIVSPSKS